jgi:hypothetical protein
MFAPPKGRHAMVKILTAVGLSLVLASNAAAAAPSGTKAPEKKYCLTFKDETGSHLSRTECRTKSEWRQLGIDVDELTSR